MSSYFNRREFLGVSAGVSTVAADVLFAAERQLSERQLEGIYVIMQTPFQQNLEVDEESLRRESDFLVRCRVHGMVWPAGAGESSSISYNERLEFSQVIVKEVRGRTPVFIGVHGANKFEAMEYARHAEKIGADGLHALGPSDGSSDPEILEDYFTAITSVSKLPLCIQVSTPGMTPDFLMRLSERLPTFRIAKEEGQRVPHNVTRYVQEGNRRLIPSTGGGAMNLLNEMARNSGGTMAGAGFADILVAIWDLYHIGKKKEGRDLFSKFLLMAVLESQTGFVLQKEILRRRGGVFKTVVMRNTRKFSMDKGDLAELDEIMEVMRPHLRA
jgi:dihydrodipicolinate synthase/N-acetylneuraminate lyase